MKKQLYIHVGFPKTGTTSTQSFLGKNQAALREEFDLDYLFHIDPDHIKQSAHHPYSPYIYAYNNIFNIKYTPISFDESTCEISENPEIIEELLEKIKNSKYNRILFSSEEFIFMKDLSFFENKFFDDYDVKIIVYVRRALEYLCSFWSYHYCNPFGASTAIHNPYLEAFVKNNTEHNILLDNIFKLGGIFGKENIIIRTFEKERLQDTSLIEDFLNIFDIKHTDKLSTPIHENSHPANRKINDIVKNLTIVHDSITQKYKHQDFNDLVSEVQGGDTRKVIETLDDSLIKEVCDAYAETENRIAKEFCNRDQLFATQYPSCYGKERAPYQPLTKEDNLVILKWVASIAEKRVTYKNKLYWALLDGYYLSQARKVLINLIPSKKLRHQLRAKFR